MRKLHLNCAGLFALLLAISAVGASDSDAHAIEETYKAWVKATNEKDIAKWSTFLAEDPYFSPADSPPLTSREAVLAY